MKYVVVAGFFDIFHSGHLTLLEEAASCGDHLTVVVGSDAAALEQKNIHTTCSENERAAIVKAIHCVNEVVVPKDTDKLNFLDTLKKIRHPECKIQGAENDYQDVLFIVNEDGHSKEKMKVCRLLGADYQVLDGKVKEEFSGRRSSNYRQEFKQIPYRINMGGFLDQPEITKCRGGLNIVCSITPKDNNGVPIELQSRSGMATSTIDTVKRIFNNQYPHWIDNKTLAEVVLAVENPPGYKYLSGSTDAIGITTTGITKLGYGRGKIWPEYIDRIMDRDKIEWLESVLWLKQTYQRPFGLPPFLETTKPHGSHIYNIDRGANLVLESLTDKSISTLQFGLNVIYFATRNMVGQYATIRSDEINIEFPSVLCGAGGGGYMLIASETKPYDDAISFVIN